MELIYKEKDFKVKI